MQIAIVLYPGFTALDFIGPYESLRWLPDAEVRFVWHEPGPITADSGVLVVGATHSFDETPSPDIILVPGGFSTMEHARDKKLLDWVRRAHRTATWTTSVCSGSIILAAAGLLDGKRATSHWAALPALKALGVKPVGDERIVIADGAAKDGAAKDAAAKDSAAKDAAAKDGAAKNDTAENTIVTCAGVSAGIDLGLWLAGRIGGDGRAKVIQLSMEYDPQPPYDSGHMSKASATTKAAATALMSKDIVKPTQLKAMSGLLWDHAISAARSRRKRRLVTSRG
jgi:putative intracellular protease/amidase